MSSQEKENPTMLCKQCRVSKSGIVFSIYCGINPTAQAKQEVKRQLIEFINNHEIQGQQLINVAISASQEVVH